MARAARQHAVVTGDDLAAAGLGRGAIARRLAEGRLRRIHFGVYLVGPAPLPRTRDMAAVLACGRTAVLSHRSAAALWGIRPPWNGPVDVTASAGHPRGDAGIRVHRVRTLDKTDITRRQGVPVTAPARTLLDLAGVLHPRDLARALEEAEVRRLVTRRQLAALLARSRGRAGAAALREALRQYDEPALTRSEAEARMLDLIRAARLPPPCTNARVGRHEVDFLWPAERLVVEVDGFAFHSTRAAFERDRAKDAELHILGYRVVRITWRQIAHEPEAVVATVAAALNA
jgi:very-short-patch-repair endonuclease